jgi:ThiF family
VGRPSLSRQQIRLSPDLLELQDEGYEVDVREGLLVVGRVPYLNADQQPRIGTFVCSLNFSGEVTAAPSDHTIWFAGEQPYRRDGSPIDLAIGNQERTMAGVIVNFQFSRAPQGGNYANYYDQVTAYVGIISGPAEEANPSLTALTHRIVEMSEADSVFLFADTASARALITEQSQLLADDRIAIVGLGGTGSYILDFVAKTHVNEIHLYDDDLFASHNAFRAPSASSLDDLNARLSKSEHFRIVWSKMRRGVVSHGYVDTSNLDELKTMSFVFVAVDDGAARRLVIPALLEARVPFIDVGMGISESRPEGPLLGQLRVSSVFPDATGAEMTIPRSDGDGNDIYDQNIQLCELNALNAAFAVIKWKKFRGFYVDTTLETVSVFQLDANFQINECR